MEVLKIILMITLATMLVVSLSIYLLRKDIFINSFRLHIGAKGLDLDISTKEKSDLPCKEDHFQQN